ncbi:MAG: FAD-dependent oxidoreductase [Burkholderiaceae bacterium]
MLATYAYPKYAYRRPVELDRPDTARAPVAVVGAGPVGLAAAIDLAQGGTPVILLDEDDTVSVGSRGVCYAKRTLEILDRLGCPQPAGRGVSWNVGRTFFDQDEVYRFDLAPQADEQRPGMVNLQQYWLEQYLVERARSLPALDLRFRNRVAGVDVRPDGVRLRIETPDGEYALVADWLVAADGARSPLRGMLGLDVDGKVFRDRFLIADVVMKADFPAERWFWFDPPFHRGQSVLLHKQADNVWRIDFQLGWDADPEEAKKPDNVIPRIRAMLGPEREFELEWVSVYTFQCRRLGDFRHGRVLFVGDSAHQVSPFGARGANSGIQDADNLCWKLGLVIAGKAPASLLDTYCVERIRAADENIANSTRSTDFITPKSRASLVFRNAVLELARHHPFARALVNSGRLSVPTHLHDSPANTPDAESFAGRMRPGAPMDDAPVAGPAGDWLLPHCGGRFTLMLFTDDPTALAPATRNALARLAQGEVPVEILLVSPPAAWPGLPGAASAPDLTAPGASIDGGASVPGVRRVCDLRGLVAERYDGRDGTCYLIRPDQHVCARWRRFDAEAVKRALARAIAAKEPAA